MVIIVRYSEIGLKGKNRHHFEKQLINNIKDYLNLNKIKFTKITSPRGRILLHTDKKCDFLKCIFGISSFSQAEEATDFEDAKIKAAEIIKIINKHSTFRITCQRLDKRFSITSQEFEKEFGAFIQKSTGAKVKLKGFDHEIHAEIIEGKIYLFTEKTRGFCGLPVGVGGNALSLIEDEKSILASLLIMNRGLKIIPIAKNKVNIELLKKFSVRFKTELKKIKNESSIDTLSKDLNVNTLIIGQTIRDFQIISTSMHVLRPLIAYNKKSIEDKLNDYRKACK